MTVLNHSLPLACSTRDGNPGPDEACIDFGLGQQPVFALVGDKTLCLGAQIGGLGNHGTPLVG